LKNLLVPSPSIPDMADGERPIELIVHSGQTTRAHVLPHHGQLLVGRAPHCDVQIDDASISRQHFCLFIGETLDLEDLGSSNGTLIASETERRNDVDETVVGGAHFRKLSVGERVSIQVGDIIRAGSAIIIVERREMHPVQATLLPVHPEPSQNQSNLFWPAVLVNAELRRLYNIAAMAAATDISVLILGETGVGKEVFAEFIHQRSLRSAKPFLRLNCAALSESLLESELFGHERGAFTGAHQSKPGLLESTDGGTVFLDEIGELPLSLQVKLLRVLDERVVRRVGSNKPRPIDVRFVTATNRDLKREVANGRFRGDLYFRINGTSFSVPPLRDRKDEIEPLARHFLTQACERLGHPVPSITAEARQRMLEYGWWGNVRELRNAMERASFLCGDGPLLATHLPEDPIPADEPAEDSTDLVFSGGVSAEAPTLGVLGRSPLYSRPVPNQISALKDLAPERNAPDSESLDEPGRLLKALNDCGGNQTRAAQLLGISRRTLINRLDLHKLPRPRKGRGGSSINE
jgi:DNA-binding NtrC family response regulator